LKSIWAVCYPFSIYDSEADGYERFFSTREKAIEYFNKRNEYYISVGIKPDKLEDKEFVKEFLLDDMTIYI